MGIIKRVISGAASFAAVAFLSVGQLHAMSYMGSGGNGMDMDGQTRYVQGFIYGVAAADGELKPTASSAPTLTTTGLRAGARTTSTASPASPLGAVTKYKYNVENVLSDIFDILKDNNESYHAGAVFGFRPDADSPLFIEAEGFMTKITPRTKGQATGTDYSKISALHRLPVAGALARIDILFQADHKIEGYGAIPFVGYRFLSLGGEMGNIEAYVKGGAGIGRYKVAGSPEKNAYPLKAAVGFTVQPAAMPGVRLGLEAAYQTVASFKEYEVTLKDQTTTAGDLGAGSTAFTAAGYTLKQKYDPELSGMMIGAHVGFGF